MKQLFNIGVLTSTLLLLVACQSPLRLNEIQLIGTHNSYKQTIDSDLLQLIAMSSAPLAGSLDYEHLPLTEQLAIGVRKFELDVFYDPDGARYQEPSGIHQIKTARPFDSTPLAAPGFKVFHIQDIDYRSHCLQLMDCLTTLKRWSDANPNHLPVFITVNAKDGVVDMPGFVKPLNFTSDAWDALDGEFRTGLADKLFTPDDLRGAAPDLPTAVAAGWPELNLVRGRFLVVLDHKGEKRADYISGHEALVGRAMFVNAEPASPEAAIMIINDPIADFEKIQGLVKQGYIVRTRSDADTREARSGDTSRREQAFDSGAQIISTDYPVPDSRFGHEFEVNFPGGIMFRCNPVLRNSSCSLGE